MGGQWAPTTLSQSSVFTPPQPAGDITVYDPVSRITTKITGRQGRHVGSLHYSQKMASISITHSMSPDAHLYVTARDIKGTSSIKTGYLI